MLVKLTMDSGLEHDKRYTIEIEKDELERIAKEYFGWRIPTKNYSTIYDRVKGLGTYRYDRFIYELVERGYEKI